MLGRTGYSTIEDRFGFRAIGTFRCTKKSETLMLAVTAAIYTLCLCIVVVNAVIVLSGDLTVPIFELEKKWEDYAPTADLVSVITSVVIMLLLTAAGIIAVLVITSGSEYRYSADEMKMVIVAPDGERTELHYSDIERVTYERLTLFMIRERGFDVCIETKYRTLRYQYIYGKNKLLREEKDTPFFILEERAGLKTRRYTDVLGV